MLTAVDCIHRVCQSDVKAVQLVRSIGVDLLLCVLCDVLCSVLFELCILCAECCSSYIMLCYVMLCYVMLCYFMLCFGMCRYSLCCRCNYKTACECCVQLLGLYALFTIYCCVTAAWPVKWLLLNDYWFLVIELITPHLITYVFCM